MPNMSEPERDENGMTYDERVKFCNMTLQVATFRMLGSGATHFDNNIFKEFLIQAISDGLEARRLAGC